RSQLTLGVNFFDATNNDNNIPDSNFLLWRTQAQYVRLVANDTLLVLRGDLQLSTEPLLSLNQISLGGLNSVRGYPQDYLLIDNGFFGSAELRLPIFKAEKIKGLLQIIPFIDYGIGWTNSSFPNPDPNNLLGIGIGLQWQMGDNLNARFDWGIPLTDVNVEEDTWNEQGLYFSVDYRF
ncbi:ShlB/FhaC/HecB family hemolysin secretion/activation protein, partial [Gloeocapsa sp. PCC 73106]|uniref:ShlB/FhaC/HecB family hemolysin secretion/activation protein n=1 Tax=Gloeocapsa sp. PCC 73106 TaxID=102232 RepID=UPI0002AC8CD0